VNNLAQGTKNYVAFETDLGGNSPSLPMREVFYHSASFADDPGTDLFSLYFPVHREKGSLASLYPARPRLNSEEISEPG
jgi:hypothetical protein